MKNIIYDVILSIIYSLLENTVIVNVLLTLLKVIIAINSLVCAVLPHIVLIIPNKLILLVDRVLVHLNVLLLLHLIVPIGAPACETGDDCNQRNKGENTSRKNSSSLLVI